MNTVFEQLDPLLGTLVDVLLGEDQTAAVRFFADIRADLAATTDEFDLQTPFAVRLADGDEIVPGYGMRTGCDRRSSRHPKALPPAGGTSAMHGGRRLHRPRPH